MELPITVTGLLAAGGGHAGHGGETLLGPESGLTFWAVITFGLVLVVLKKYAWGPLQQNLDAREQRIKDAYVAADQAREDAKRVEAEQATLLENSRREAENIIEEARKDGEGIISRARSEAEAAADETKARALKDIEQARIKALDELRQESVDLAMLLASKVLKAEVDKGQHKALIDDVIGSLGKS